MLTESLKTQIRTLHTQLKQALPGYQPRPSQNKLIAEMANIIAGSYHSYDRIGLIEAGTGTGKSLAYLIAALPLALAQKKTLVVSTATVALQEQLVNKDLPFLQRHGGVSFEFSLVKGRQRYACIERVRQQLQQPDLLLADELPVLAELATLWQQRKWLGDKDTLPFALSDNLWHAIVADHYHCPRQQAAHRDCPFHLARSEIADSQLLVVNHALLLADLDSGNSVLPPAADCIFILDEAHHLADVGRDYFAAAAQLSTDISFWQQKISKIKQLLQQQLAQFGSSSELLRLAEASDNFFTLYKAVQRQLQEYLANQSQGLEHLRFEDAQLPSCLSRQTDELQQSSQQVLQAVEKLFQWVLEQAGERQIKATLLQQLQQDLSALQQKFSAQHQLWSCWAQPASPVTQARWLSFDQQQIIGHACPLTVSFKLDDLLFSQAHAVILCSATLTTLGSFDHISRELGLTAHQGLQTLTVPSPFAYQERASILLPRLSCEPTDERFTDELCKILPAYLEKKQGNLVLFASYWQMEQVATALRSQGFSLLVQGEASRQALLDLHKMRIDGGDGSILFGTQSFSEGLDLPGNLLTNLVITKLPFAVPTSPFEEAMAEAVSKRGGNPFLLLAVPAAARKLVQACGRLLRQENDSGRIVILDRRLVSKSYGSAMLRALPPFRRVIEP